MSFSTTLHQALYTKTFNCICIGAQCGTSIVQSTLIKNLSKIRGFKSMSFDNFGIISGCPVGNILAIPITGMLAKYGFDGGWPSVFYCFGKHFISSF